MDLKRYFDSNRQEDINDLIGKSLKKSEDLKMIEMKNGQLEQNFMKNLH